MPNEKQSDLKFCQTLQVRDESGWTASHPQMTRVGLWRIISSKKGLFDCTKGLTSLWEFSVQGLSHKGWQPARNGHTDVKPWSSSRPGPWAWGQVVEEQQPGLLSWFCMFGSFSHSKFPSAKQGTNLCGHRTLWALKRILAEAGRVCLETQLQYLCLG